MRLGTTCRFGRELRVKRRSASRPLPLDIPSDSHTHQGEETYMCAYVSRAVCSPFSRNLSAVQYIDAPYENQQIFLLREKQHVSRFSAKISTFGLSSAKTSTFGLFATKTSTFGISSSKSSTFSLLVQTPRTAPHAINFSRIKIFFL